jgi:hypothetical protein
MTVSDSHLLRSIAKSDISTMQLLEYKVFKHATTTRCVPAVHQDRPGTSTRGYEEVAVQLAGVTPRRAVRGTRRQRDSAQGGNKMQPVVQGFLT